MLRRVIFTLVALSAVFLVSSAEAAPPELCLFRPCPHRYPDCCTCACEHTNCECEYTCGVRYDNNKDWGQYNHCVNACERRHRGCLIDCRKPSGFCRVIP